MVKIEMAVELSPEFPAGKSTEYIWMLGQKWPVPLYQDPKIARIEVFGTELEEIGGRFSGGQSLKNQEGLVLCRAWYGNDARYVSEQMRIFYP